MKVFHSSQISSGQAAQDNTVIDITARLARPEGRSSEPTCVCATTLAEVESAWRLVYKRYSEMGLIDENPFGIHAALAAVGRHASVIWGPEGPETGYTMTLFRDNPMGLALDSVYASTLDEMRAQGRRLMEVGMLADRRQSVARGVGALFSMMRWAVHYALHNGLTDVVIGVHPHHAQFYERCYGFEVFAPPTSYPMVHNRPVIGLRLRLQEALAKDVLPRGLADARDNPIPAEAFSKRFGFEPEQMRDSQIENFLKDRYGVDSAGETDTVCDVALSA